MNKVTQILDAIQRGDAHAGEELLIRLEIRARPRRCGRVYAN